MRIGRILPGRRRELEIDAGIVIDLDRGRQIKLIDRNRRLAISRVEQVSGENVVMDLLRRAPVFEDKCERLLAVRGGLRLRRRARLRSVWPRRQFLFYRLLLVVLSAAIGLRRGQLVVGGV